MILENRQPVRGLKRLARGLARGAIVLAAVGLLITLCPSRFWLLEAAAYWVPSYLFLAMLGTVACLAFGGWRWPVLGLLCAGLAGALIVPCYFPAARPAGGGHAANFRLLQANVFEHHGDAEALMRLVRSLSPDVVLLQESDAFWEAALHPLEAEYPHRAFVPRGAKGAADLGVLWRGGPERVCALGEQGIPAAELEIQVAGRTIRVLNVHPTSPHSPDRARRHEAQMQALAGYVAGVQEPIILAGDLNTSVWSRWYKRLLAQGRLVNAKQGFGVLGTWPSFLGPLRTTLDNALVSRDIEVVRTWVGPGIGSDHRPLITDLYVPPLLSFCEKRK